MIRKILTVAAIAASTAVGIASTAQAGDWQGRRGYGYGHGPRYAYPVPPPAPYYGHYPAPRRDRSGEKIAKGVAIGIGALVLGSILANEARRHREYDGY